MNQHVDMSQFIAPKSDQLNADDLIAGPRTITITRVTGNEGNAEQPVNVFYAEDEKHPFRPCKSMRRVMVKIWGADAAKYPGQAMTLFRDPKVKWGGMEVGGIRISHMTGIDAPQTMALTETRAARKPYTVHPLTVEAATDKAAEAADKIIANIGRAPDAAKLDAYIAGKPSEVIEGWRTDRPDLASRIDAALIERRATFAPADDDDPFGDTDTKSPADTFLSDLRAQIAAAKTGPALKKADDRWVQNRAAYDDGVAAEIDALLGERRREIGGAES